MPDNDPDFVYIDTDFAREALRVFMGTSFSDGRRLLIQNGGISGNTIIESEDLSPQEPSIVIPRRHAAKLYNELAAYFQGHDDTRALRADYLDERKRVDKLTDALIEAHGVVLRS